MFWDDIKLVSEVVSRYGLVKPLTDLGGLERPCIVDYDRTKKTRRQESRYITLSCRPFDHIDKDYLILNPEQGEPYIEDLPEKYGEYFGTIVCLSVLEHVKNPFKVFDAFYKILKNDGLLIISTVFEYPYHPGPIDFWRYSPEALRYLGEGVGFKVLECDWRLNVEAADGILDCRNKQQVVRSVYCVLSKIDKPLLNSGVQYELPVPIVTKPKSFLFRLFSK
jgi:hypothetical protein